MPQSVPTPPDTVNVTEKLDELEKIAASLALVLYDLTVQLDPVLRQEPATDAVPCEASPILPLSLLPRLLNLLGLLRGANDDVRRLADRIKDRLGWN